jgi:hypothetical protein
MNKIAVMQPYLFPYIGYFQLINSVDKFVIFDDVNYINKGWINRNNILMNNMATMFTLSLQGASQNKRIDEIHIAEQEKWNLKFIKTLRMAYAKAPFFNEGLDLIQSILDYKEDNLSLFLGNSIKSISDYLEIKAEIIPSSKKYDTQLLKAQDKIIKICSRENASEYINPIGGIELYSKGAFENNKIKLTFIKTDSVIYKQFKDTFVPNLSIIDVIMFNGRETKQFLNKCVFLDGL